MPVTGISGSKLQTDNKKTDGVIMRTDYLIPDHLDANTVEARLCEQLSLTVEPARQEQRIYYDTFDWRLYKKSSTIWNRSSRESRPGFATTQETCATS